jgi:hypothetical protein
MTSWTRSKARPIVGRRSGETCEIDGWRPAESLSHRISRSRGGTWAPSNLLHVCGDGTPAGRGCHWWLEDRKEWAKQGGWHIRRDPRPANEVPLYLRPPMNASGWFLIRDEGGPYLVPVDPADYGLPQMPAHFPPSAARPLHTTPWVDPR